MAYKYTRGQILYPFNGLNRNLGGSNVTDLKYCIDLIEKMGFNIYIRNNSILGFPTYYIIIPGMSQILMKRPSELNVYTETFYKISYLNKLGSLDVNTATELFDAMNENYTSMKDQNFELKRAWVYNVNEDLNNCSLELFMSMLAYYVGDNVKSLDYLKKYLIGKNKLEYRYFYACAEYLRMRNEGIHSVVFLLTQLYGEQIAKEVIDDFKDPKKIFQYYKLPNCPNCKQCKLIEDCRYNNMLDLRKKIRIVANNNEIDQSDIRLVLENNIE